MQLTYNIHGYVYIYIHAYMHAYIHNDTCMILTYTDIHTYIHTSLRVLTEDEEDALGWTEKKYIAAKLIALCAMDGSGWKAVLPALKVETPLCMYPRMSE